MDEKPIDILQTYKYTSFNSGICDYPIKITNDLELPQKGMLGDEEIELDESMFYGEEYLCPKCRELGYCRKRANIGLIT